MHVTVREVEVEVDQVGVPLVMAVSASLTVGRPGMLSLEDLDLDVLSGSGVGFHFHGHRLRLAIDGEVRPAISKRPVTTVADL